jgi:hypothetical protein
MMMMRYFGQIVNIKLPDLGEGTKEATVKEILVKVGQKVEEVRLFFNFSVRRPLRSVHR